MSHGRRRTLLVADDSPTVRKVVSLTFNDEGLEVFTADSGQQALEKLRTVVPDVVLADVLMPEPNGYQLCEHIKQDERLRHTPVVLLVGTFEPFNEAEARKVGADDVLTKPFQSIRDLIKRVTALFTGGQSEASHESAGTLPAAAAGGHDGSTAYAESVQPAAAVAPTVSWEQPAAERYQAAAPADRYFDPSMDDLSIESHPVAQPVKWEEPAPAVSWEAPPASAAVAESASSMENEDKFETISSAPFSHPAPAYAAPIAAPIVVAAPAPISFNTRTANATAADDTLLDLGDGESSAPAIADDDDFILDIGDAPPAARPAPTLPTTYSRKAAKRARANGKSAAAKTAHVIAKPQAKGTESAVSKVKEEIMKAGISTALNIDQMPTETVDAVARRVVEHLSDKVIREIAWEVVPDLAERLIKQRLDEQKLKA